MDTKAIFENLKGRFGEKILECVEPKGDMFIRIAPDALLEVCRALKEAPELGFDFPECVSGVDHGTELGVVYHLYSHAHRHKVVLSVRVPKEKPEVPSVDAVWAGVNWHERETYDLMGVIFTGSRDLRRILLPEGWEGHPLRKDYKPPESFEGIPLN